MKESVLDVLMYLFEHYFDEDADVEADRDELNDELVQAGFPEREIAKAFAWLEELSFEPSGGQSPISGVTIRSARIFTQSEQDRLDVECRGLLLFLEQAGVLDATTREVVIDRVMALEAEAIDIEHLKWVTLMVLFNQPGQEKVTPWMEELVFDRSAGPLH